MLINRRRGRGFTVIELLMVVAIGVILASIAVPTYMSLLPAMRLKSSAREVAAALQIARVKAISKNNYYKVVFSTNGTYQTFKQVGGSSWEADTGIQSVDSQISFNRNGSDPITFTNDEAIYKPTGSLSGSSGGVYLKNSKGQIYAVTVVNTSGRVKVQKA